MKKSILDCWLRLECASAGRCNTVLKMLTNMSSWQLLKMTSFYLTISIWNKACLNTSRPLKQVSKVSVGKRSQKYLFGKLLSNCKFKTSLEEFISSKVPWLQHILQTPLYGCIWSMRIILWDKSYFFLTFKQYSCSWLK